jgi:CubicO group peptidase (beta-lactamase class C family)
VQALQLTAEWPVPTVAAVVVLPDGSTTSVGDIDHVFRLASISKMLTGWAALIAVEEGIVGLDEPAGQPGCTLRHLLSHAGGYGFDDPQPFSRPERRRMYSNSGIELAAALVAERAGMPFATYLAEAVFQPLGMTSSALPGSPAHQVRSTVRDLLAFTRELRTPTLLSPHGATEFRTVQFPTLGGIIPGVGRYEPCPWGLGCEVRGTKSPHWTGTRNSPSTFGHFGGAGTFLWVDPDHDVATVALTDRPFDEWAAEALRLWPQLSDAVLHEIDVTTEPDG